MKEEEDYSLAGMVRRLEAVKGGPLKPKEHAKLVELANRLAEIDKQLADHKAEVEERERKAALEAAIERIKEKDRERKQVSPDDPDFGSENKIFTKAKADAATARLNAYFQGEKSSPDATQMNVKPRTIYRSVYDFLAKLVKMFKPPVR
jgi:hypothetical protein